TSFITWVGIDERAVSSVYFASDSRLSLSYKDPNTGKTINNWLWDHGRKLFACQNFPDIFGYVGDVLFPSQILSELVDLIDTGVIFGTEDHPDKRMEKIISFLEEAAIGYPFMDNVRIYYCSRVDINNRSSNRSWFRLFRLTFQNDKWNPDPIGISKEKSGELIIDGSGRSNIQASLQKWKKSPQGNTSRSIFSAFCDGLETTTDPLSGGPPQLVGIHRKGMGQYFGVVYQKKSFFLGLPIKNAIKPEKIQWFDDLFQVADGKTKRRMVGAQVHEDIQ
ncbi:MAG: hypothetical protein AAGU75_20550, partial [Bacillota bacterium]